MAAEDILGISGQMDISDIQQSFDKLISNLNSLGVKTNEVSSKMTKALNDIAQSSASDSEKTKQSVQTLKSGIEEINKSLANTPEALKKLASEAQTAEATVDKLKKRLSETTEGSQKWNEINEQLKTQQNLVIKLNGEYSSMLGTFGSTQQYVGTLNAAIDTLNAGRSISTAATGASAVAHVGAAAAVGSEALAHGENSSKIADETQKLQENTEASKARRTAALDAMSDTEKQIRETDAVTDALNKGEEAQDAYNKAKKETEAQINSLISKLEEEERKLKEAQEAEVKLEEQPYRYVSDNGEFYETTKKSSDEVKALNAVMNEAFAKIKEYKKQIESLTASLNDLNTANSSTVRQAKEVVSTDAEQIEAIKAKEEELKKYKDELAELEAHHAQGWGSDFITNLRAGENPFSSISNYFKEGNEIQEKKQQISDVTEELEKLKTVTEDVKTTSTDMWSGQSEEQIANTIKEDIEQLKILKSEYQNIVTVKGKNSDEAKKNKQQQEDITKEILEGKNRLKEMCVAYEDVIKGAKKTQEETKNIGKEAEDASKKVIGIFSKMKGALGGAMKGDFSGIFSVFGKFIGWGAALGVIGKSLYELTQRAEEFKEALQPLSHYIDENRLEDVRQDILALSGSTTKSVSDMASAATQFVKVWDGLRESPEALITMVKSANEFGALAGKTSEESANYLANLASEYHMTAQQATEATAMIATAAHGSTSTFGEMAEALKSAGSTASMYGVSFKDMATLIGYSANNFGGAQKAASKFSMLLMNMENQQNSKFKPSVVGMVQALQNMKVAMDKGELSQKTFGSRIRQTAKYFINNAEAIAEYGKHIDSNKAKQEGLNDVNARATNNVAKLQNAWDGMLTSLNANYTPILTNILNFFNKIIGGAQETAEKLNYIKNFDKLHPKVKQNGEYVRAVISDRPETTETAIAATSFINQYNRSKEEGYEQYQKQKKLLETRYRKQYNVYRDQFENASDDDIIRMTNKSLVRFFENNRGRYNEFNAETFNQWLRGQRNNIKAMNQKTNNSDNGGGGNFKPEPDKDAEKKAKQQRKAQEELDKELASLEQKNIDNNISLMEEGTEKKLAQIKNDYKKRRDEIDKQEKEFKKKNKEAGKKGDLTKEQSDALNEARLLAEKEYNKKIGDVNKESLSAMRDYIKEFGSYLQQRLAMVEDYDEKIAKAQTEGEKKTLQKQKEQALANLEYENISMGIDWKGLLSGVGNMSQEMLQPMLDKLDAYTNTDEYNKADTQTQQKVVELMQELRKYLGTDQSVTWEKLAKAMEDFSKAVALYQQALKNEQKAQSNLEKGKQDLEEGKITEEAFNKMKDAADEASEAVVDSKKKMDTLGVAVNSATDAVKNYTSGLTTALNKAGVWKQAEGFSQIQGAVGSIDELKGALDTSLASMGDGMAKDIGEKLSSTVGSALSTVGGGIESVLSSGLGQIIGFIGQIPKLILQIVSAIKNFVTSFLNAISEIFKFEWLSDLVNSILAAIANLIDTILDAPDNFNKALESIIVNGIGGLLDSVLGRLINSATFGHVKNNPSDWFTGSNEEEIAEKRQELIDEAERLAQSIEGLKKELQNQSGIKAINTATELVELQKQQIANAMQQIINENNYHSAHHSNDSYWRENAFEEYDGGSWQRLTELLQAYKNANPNASTTTDQAWSYEDLLKLTPEQMEYIRSHDANQWQSILNVGKYDASDEKWNAYADLAGTLEETMESLRESLTRTSFDSLKDDFVSTLMEMDTSAADFSDKFSEYLMQAVLNAQISNLLEDEMNAFYKDWAARQQANGGTLTEDDVNALKTQWDDIVQKGLDIRDEMSKITGYTGESSSSQTATGKAIEAITEDQASTLIGIGYAMQIAVEQGNEVRNAISVDVSALRLYAEQNANNLSEMRDIQYQGLEQLEAINRNTAPIILIREDIASMYKLMKDRY